VISKYPLDIRRATISCTIVFVTLGPYPNTEHRGPLPTIIREITNYCAD